MNPTNPTGDDGSLQDFLANHYEALRNMTRQAKAYHPSETAQPTDLANMIVLRVCEKAGKNLTAANARGYFRTEIASLLKDRWRARTRLKRGGGWVRTDDVELLPAGASTEIDLELMERLLEAIETLGTDRTFHRAAKVIELELEGRTRAEIATELGLTEGQVANEKRKALAFLREHIEEPR